jgi:DNA-directed RNA polymerase subunit H (RpoH/RPB5)
MAILKTYFILCICLCCQLLVAQDKLILKTGKIKTVRIVSITNQLVIYQDSANAESTSHIKKEELSLIEKKDGSILLLDAKKGDVIKKWEVETDSIMTTWRKKESLLGNHLIGIQPLSLFFGRASFNYEYLFSDKKVGIMIPLILTFNPYKNNGNNFGTPSTRYINQKEPDFIYGLDLNFYFSKRPVTKFFVGPRVRYGNDVLSRIKGLTGQFQFGWMVSGEKSRFPQHFSIGVGFVSLENRAISRDKYFGWGSINYRINFRP